MITPNLFTFTSSNCILVDEACCSCEIINLRISNIGFVNAIKSFDITVTLLFEVGKIERQAVDSSDAVVFHEVRVFYEGCQVEHNFFGDAPDVDTGTSDCLVLDHGNFFSEEGSTAAGTKTTRTSTNNDKVIIFDRTSRAKSSLSK